MKKNLVKILITISVFLSIIFIGCIILMVWLLNKDSFHNDTTSSTSSTSISKNIPEKYQGTWINHFYLKTAYNNDTIEYDTNHTLTISANDIQSDIDSETIQKYTIDDSNLILTYINNNTGKEYTKYVLLEGDSLYVSDDEKVDNRDSCYFKKGSSAEQTNYFEYRATYYTDNIGYLAESVLKENFDLNEYIIFVDSKHLTDDQKIKKEDSDYYYAFYEGSASTTELAIDKTTGKLAKIKYTEKLNVLNTSQIALNRNTSVLYAVCALIYADNNNISNINKADSLTQETAKLSGSSTVASLLTKQSESKNTSEFYETEYAKISFSYLVSDNENGKIEFTLETKNN